MNAAFSLHASYKQRVPRPQIQMVTSGNCCVSVLCYTRFVRVNLSFRCNEAYCPIADVGTVQWYAIVIVVLRLNSLSSFSYDVLMERGEL